jgi:hypothetical protein
MPAEPKKFFPFLRGYDIINKFHGLRRSAMDTVENLQNDLENCLGGINSAGLDNVDPPNIEKLEKIAAVAANLGMKQGKQLVDNLVSVLKALKEGKSTVNSVSVRLTALEFYLSNTKGAATEEL